MVRLWNVVADACRRGLRRACVATTTAMLLANVAAAQEVEFEFDTPSPGVEEYGELVEGDGAFFQAPPNGVEEPEMLSGLPMLDGLPPRMYPPGGSVGPPPGMPIMLPGDGDVPWHRPLGPDKPPRHYSPCLTRLGFRHSYTHGRNVGWGWPLRGTSWLNRPYYLGLGLGPMWFTRPPQEDVTRDKDVLGVFIIGWDWDYYWGTEVQFSYATPELFNTRNPDANPSDRLFNGNINVYYYPWGDSKLRPYWRFGVGYTDVDYPIPDGPRYDETVLTIPYGIGVKYPFHRWWAGRVEVVDYWSIAHSGVDTLHNVAVTFALEWRFGVRPKSYFPWHPSGQIW